MIGTTVAPGRRGARLGARAAGTAVSLTIAFVLALQLSGGPRSAKTASITVSVAIDQRHPGARVPLAFLGLSFELSSLSMIAHYAHSGDLATLLHSLGAGMLRFGGASADTRVAWTDAATRRPAWASSVLRIGELRDLRVLAERSGWPILLTIGLAHFDPRAAAREAAAAKAALGGWLAGIELGNEPDAYARHGLRSAPWTFSRYNAEVAVYRRAIEHAAPDIKLVGPDVSGSHIFGTWGRGTALGQRPALLTGHHYPLGCHKKLAPTIARLLSRRTRWAEKASLDRYVAVSRASATHFRLDETNSVSCGGKAGISNTFASTLWAVDYIAHAMAAGIVGLNFQGNPANCQGYAPVCAPTSQQLTQGDLVAQPEWYSLLLSMGLIGDRPVRAIASPSRANVDVIALLGRQGKLDVVIVDDDPPGAKRATVRLHVGRGFETATVLPLTAPSLTATAGVRLGGRAVESDGRWRAPARLQHRPNRAGVITVDVLPASAMLVTATPGREPPS